MKTVPSIQLVLAIAIASTGPALGQVPTSNDTSDINFNTGMGKGALGGPKASNEGLENTASGYNALGNNTIGGYNTAAGFQALFNNTSGSENVAFGEQTLSSNTTGIQNTACGSETLYSNTTGDNNTASGYLALFTNSTGDNNTASGYLALRWNTGSDNTGTGANALTSNTIGNFDTATGYDALFLNTTGTGNVADGYSALLHNKQGNYNAAFGFEALYTNNPGSNNIAVGYRAGFDLTTGSDNIDIGNLGVADESGVIRIGTSSTQTSAYIAGIYNVTTITAGLPVLVDSTGQLGTVSSSERFKTAIAPMGSNSAKLRELRPVTFLYKADPRSTLRYGLIAEQVAAVYPELVVRDQHGRIDGVRYDELAPMLLNEVQKQAAEIRKLKQQQKQLATQADVNELKQQLQAALAAVLLKDQLIGRR